MAQDEINSPRALAAACANGVIGVLVFALLPVILGALDDRFELNDVELGVTASSFYGSYALVTLASAFWIRRVNWRTATLAGVTAMMSAMLLPVLWPTHTAVISAFILAGFGAAVVFGISYAAVGDRKEKDRGFAIKLVPEQLVPALVLIIISSAFAHWLSFPNIFVLLAVVIGLCSMLTLGLPPMGAQAIEPKPRWSDFSPEMLIALFGMITFFAGFAGLWAFMERIASEGDLDPDKTGLLLAIGLIGAGVGSFLAALAGDRFGRRNSILAGTTISTACLVLLTGEQSIMTFGTVMVLVPTAWYFALAYFFGVIADADHSGRLVGLTAFALAVGALSGPTLFGIARSLGSSGAGFAATCFIVGTALILWAEKRLDQHGNQAKAEAP